MMGDKGNMLGPALISAEAQAFIDNAPEILPFDLTLESIGAVRAQTRADLTPAAERAVQRHRVTLRDIEVAGVPCMEITPEVSTPSRTILYCYGGGYVVGSPFEDLPVSAALAEHTGARIVAPNYRLAPEHPYPAAVEDGWAVCQALTAECLAGTLAIAGESAGGNLALVLLQRLHKAGLAMPVAAALCSPWADLASQGDSSTANDGRDPTLSAGHDGQATRAYVGANDPADPDISPVRGFYDQTFPPTFITTGTRDLLLSHSVRLARVMRDAGVDVDLRVWEGLWHVFEFYDEIPEAALSLRQIGEFLTAHFEKASA